MLDAVQAGAVMTAEERREEARRDWLARAEQTLEAAQQAAEATSAANPAKMSSQLKSLVEAAEKAECLRGEDRAGLAARAKAIEVTVYARGFEQVLAWGRAAIRKGDQQALATTLKTAGDLVAALRKLGLDQAGCDGLKEKIALLRETASAGDSKKAKAEQRDIGPKGYDNDRRAFVRYTDPRLVVELGGRPYLTVDWGLGGVLLEGVAAPPDAIGKLVALKIKVEGGRQHEERATIVRHDADKQQLALQFRRFGSALVTIKKECETLGQDPA